MSKVLLSKPIFLSYRTTGTEALDFKSNLNVGFEANQVEVECHVVWFDEATSAQYRRQWVLTSSLLNGQDLALTNSIQVIRPAVHKLERPQTFLGPYTFSLVTLDSADGNQGSRTPATSPAANTLIGITLTFSRVE